MRQQNSWTAEIIRIVSDMQMHRLFHNPEPNVTTDQAVFNVLILKYGIKIRASCDAASSYAWNL